MQKLSATEWADLKDYPLRSRVWESLHGEEKLHFQKATVLSIVRDAIEQNGSLAGLEAGIEEGIARLDVIEPVLTDSSVDNMFKLQLINDIGVIAEDLFARFIFHTRLLYPEAVLAGKIITKRNWKETVIAITGVIEYRDDLGATLYECQHLLGSLKKGSYKWWEHWRAERTSPDEWWNEFLQTCLSLYPKGPGERMIWTQAGGEEHDLPTSGSGKEQWVHVLERIRAEAYNRITIKKLVGKMMEENSNNERLKWLKKTIKDHE